MSFAVFHIFMYASETRSIKTTDEKGADSFEIWGYEDDGC